jgi:hypothetical protein
MKSENLTKKKMKNNDNNNKKQEQEGKKKNLPSGEMKRRKNPRRISGSPTESLVRVLFFW